MTIRIDAHTGRAVLVGDDGEEDVMASRPGKLPPAADVLGTAPVPREARGRYIFITEEWEAWDAAEQIDDRARDALLAGGKVCLVDRQTGEVTLLLRAADEEQ